MCRKRAGRGEVAAADAAVVPEAGFEPARPFGQQILSLERLPFRHSGHAQLVPTSETFYALGEPENEGLAVNLRPGAG